MTNKYLSNSQKEILWAGIENKITGSKKPAFFYLFTSGAVATAAVLIIVFNILNFQKENAAETGNGSYLYSDIADVPDFGTAIENYFL
ncbi:MAG: hypothetical protein JXA66_02590 [Oligoflexia bacterium]|nr:hypothetical protein [Oligoflexia bacterium]